MLEPLVARIRRLQRLTAEGGVVPHQAHLNVFGEPLLAQCVLLRPAEEAVVRRVHLRLICSVRSNQLFQQLRIRPDLFLNLHDRFTHRRLE